MATLVNWFGAWAVSYTFNFLMSWSSYGKNYITSFTFFCLKIWQGIPSIFHHCLQELSSFTRWSTHWPLSLSSQWCLKPRGRHWRRSRLWSIHSWTDFCSPRFWILSTLSYLATLSFNSRHYVQILKASKDSLPNDMIIHLSFVSYVFVMHTFVIHSYLSNNNLHNLQKNICNL